QEQEAVLRAMQGAHEPDRRKFSALVDFTDAGYLVFNSALQVIWANEVFLTKFTPTVAGASGVIGATCNKVLCRREKICDRCPALQPFTSGLGAHHEVLSDMEGRSRHLYTTGMPIASTEGDIDETIVMVQDVSELKVL